jgi:prepilin-type processing-associated H-X9-DG protein
MARQLERNNGLAQVIPYNSSAGKVDTGFFSKNDGTSATVLLAENVNAISWAMLEEGATTIVWTTQEDWLPRDDKGQQFAINTGQEQFLDDQLLDFARNKPQDLLQVARPSSNHSGGVNVAYCDGHVDFLSEDISTWVYAQRLSVSNSQARHPFTGLNKQIPGQMLPPPSP